MSRRTLIAVPVVLALAASAPADAGVRRAQALRAAHHTLRLEQRVTHPGKYDVTLVIAGGRRARRDVVDVFVERAVRRGVRVTPRRGRVRLRVWIGDRTMDVRVVGRRSRPRVRASLRLLGSQARKKKIATAPIAPPPAPPPPESPPSASGPEKLVWADEFNTPAGALPDARWWEAQTGDGWGNGAELQTYTARPANASTDGAGHLAITARSEPGVGAHGYTSARLETRGRFSFTYGRLEARMKFPSGTGLWPALWALGDDVTSVGWPAAGEIDVMEALGQQPNVAYGHVHGPAGTSGAEYSWGRAITSAASLSGDFHTYGLIWQPDAIQWTLDGAVYATFTKAELQPGQRWVYDHPFHVLLDLAVGGAWPGSPDATTPFPATLLVDWIRVYQ
jgi:hypothetical protein